MVRDKKDLEKFSEFYLHHIRTSGLGYGSVHRVHTSLLVCWTNPGVQGGELVGTDVLSHTSGPWSDTSGPVHRVQIQRS